jgi:hypothetical protein
MKHIQVRINEAGALRNQQFAFSDRFTVVMELMQNARRAGATQIEITYDYTTRKLQVTDNGHGIEDFSKLLAFNESGWNDAVQTAEHPFGIGFSYCLYAASRCIVTSRGQQVDFITTEALAKAEIPVLETGPKDQCGTTVELYDINLEGIERKIADLCSGFPVPVMFEGNAIPNPRAEHMLPAAEETPIGRVYLQGTHDGCRSERTLVYLQGFLVLDMPKSYLLFGYDTPNVIHLDPTVFHARLPDRTVLIDPDVQERRIQDQIKASWREILLKRRADMEQDDFIECFYKAMYQHRHLDLVCDIDFLPREMCGSISAYPVQSSINDADPLKRPLHPLSRTEIENKNVNLVNLCRQYSQNAPQWMFAKAKGFIVFTNTGLPTAHWVQRHVRDLNTESVQIEIVREQYRRSFVGRQVSAEVVLCDAIKLSFGNDSVTITDEGLYHEDKLYIPANEHSGRVVGQVSDYCGTTTYSNETDRRADMTALESLICLSRMTNPQDALCGLLNAMQPEKFPLLHNRTFQVCIGQEVGMLKVETVA